ncbi:BioY family protein [Listeria fleischmannii subsp. fleischmannii LU2006-1]|nr:BioY family protein [Listeria fleischmannii subsp. fleischmannii LU2006-1]
MSNQKLKFLIVDALFAVIIAILAQIAIPIGPIPFTGQTFAVGLAATILGARNATISVSVYILLGAFGIPVFQGMTAGLGIILGVTGGFIIGFIGNAFFNGLSTRQIRLYQFKRHHRQYIRCICNASIRHVLVTN